MPLLQPVLEKKLAKLGLTKNIRQKRNDGWLQASEKNNIERERESQETPAPNDG
jgi:hypothetical protein